MKTVLIVDDEISDSLERIITNPEIRVIKAVTGEQAIRVIDTERIDTASIDAYFPYREGEKPALNGNRIAAYLRAAYTDAKIIGVSSDPDSFDSKYFDVIMKKAGMDRTEYKRNMEG